MFLKDSITLAFSHTGFVHKRSIAHIYGIYLILMPITVLTYHTFCFHVGKTDPVSDTKGILSCLSVFFIVAVDALILLKGMTIVFREKYLAATSLALGDLSFKKRSLYR